MGHLTKRRGMTAAVALLAGGLGSSVASAQSGPAAPAQAEEITVTATRIARSGFTAPTPTTTFSAEEIQLRAVTNIANLLTDQPSFRASNTPSATSPTASQNAGSNFANLRGIGPQRTLILVDGRRHVPTNSSGLVDLNAIPMILVDRVEVVTGGASAAWGSDAVAGVVNLILDNKFNGVKAEAQYGISDYNDNLEYKAGFAFGTAIGSRAHITFAGEVNNNRGVVDMARRPWGDDAWTVVANPAYAPGNGQFQRIIAVNGHPSNASYGGMIASGPLAGTQFLPGGVPAPFVYGQYRTASFMAGGDGTQMGNNTSLATPLDRQNIFSHIDLDVTDKVQAFAEVSYARSHTKNDVVQPYDFGSIPINVNNAFLPASVRNQLLALGQTSFNMGRVNDDFGFYRTNISNQTYRGAFGLKAELAENWKGNAYYQYGQTDYKATLRNRNVAKFNASVDSVTSPTTGQPVCRINADAVTTNDDPSCVPVNLFGVGAPSQAAIGYFMGQQWQKSKLTQHSAAASVQGQPFSTWAGVVSVVGGVEYRREAVDTTVDAVSAASGFTIGNPKAIAGSYNTKEFFAETIVPLLAGMPFAKLVELNAAYRYTDYSTSGPANTWKIGGTWAVDDQLRLRITKSRDLRAPNLDELYTTGQLRFSTVLDPVSGQQVNISTLAGGNLGLKPETAKTLTFGGVFEPSWVKGLRASVDYYKINVRDAIGTLTGQDVLNRCAGGATALCSRVTRVNGLPSQIVLTQLNLNQLKTRGIDLELSYNFPVSSVVAGWGGDLTLRGLASYVKELSTFDGITKIDRAGDVGPGLGGVPHWRWNADVTYRLAPFTVNVQGRYIAGGAYDHTFGQFGINDNTVDSMFLVNAAVQYAAIENGSRKLTFFANVKNAFNKAPPKAPASGFIAQYTNNELYDVIGRTWMMGARYQF